MAQETKNLTPWPAFSFDPDENSAPGEIPENPRRVRSRHVPIHGVAFFSAAGAFA
jgi:hypothetical protein